jgi:hypothetical protein
MTTEKKTSGQLEVERRREQNKIVIADLSVCYHCKKPNLKETDVYCDNCGFPQRGNELEQRKFIAKFNADKMFQDQLQHSIKKARNILYILAGLNALFGIVLGLLMTVDIPVLIVCIVSALIYLGLGIWSKSKPFPAIITGFIFYITLIIISAIVDPATIIQGIIWKVVIISGFYYGYKGAKEAEEIKEQIEVQKNGASIQ